MDGWMDVKKFAIDRIWKIGKRRVWMDWKLRKSTSAKVSLFWGGVAESMAKSTWSRSLGRKRERPISLEDLTGGWNSY